jgi:hypothetical protein
MARRRWKAFSFLTVRVAGVFRSPSLTISAGDLIFACHRVNSYNRGTSNPVDRLSYGIQDSHTIQHYYGNYSQTQLPPSSFAEHSYAHSDPATSPTQPHFGYSSWSSSHVENAANPLQYDSWSTDQAISPGQAHPSTLSTYGSPYTASAGSSHGDRPSPASRHRRHRSRSPYESSVTGSVDEQIPSAAGPISSTRRSSPSNVRDAYHGTSGRNSGLPPIGVDNCASCGVTQSPEWRKGPNGKKDLCNAYATCHSPTAR